MRFVTEGREVRDLTKNRTAGFMTDEEAAEAADWLNSGDAAADPEAFIWRNS